MLRLATIGCSLLSSQEVYRVATAIRLRPVANGKHSANRQVGSQSEQKLSIIQELGLAVTVVQYPAGPASSVQMQPDVGLLVQLAGLSYSESGCSLEGGDTNNRSPTTTRVTDVIARTTAEVHQLALRDVTEVPLVISLRLLCCYQNLHCSSPPLISICGTAYAVSFTHTVTQSAPKRNAVRCTTSPSRVSCSVVTRVANILTSSLLQNSRPDTTRLAGDITVRRPSLAWHPGA